MAALLKKLVRVARRHVLQTRSKKGSEALQEKHATVLQGFPASDNAQCAWGIFYRYLCVEGE